MATATEVKERPILFSTPMIKALLEGRKTQTRRIIKPQPTAIGVSESGVEEPHSGIWYEYGEGTAGTVWTCPYGKPGDHLWVRETWAVV